MLEKGNVYVTITHADRSPRISRQSGRGPYARWFNDLNAQAAAKVTTATTGISLGNFSNVKGIGRGVYECTIDFGPGYRIYFGKDGERLVILLGGEEAATEGHQ